MADTIDIMRRECNLIAIYSLSLLRFHVITWEVYCYINDSPKMRAAHQATLDELLRR